MFGLLLATASQPFSHDAACPHKHEISRPLARAPSPESLAYRHSKAHKTGSFTDGDDYIDFALAASVNDTKFATFRQTYFHRKFAGIEFDGRNTWNSQFYACHIQQTLEDVGRDDLLQRGIPIIMELDMIGAGYTYRLAGRSCGRSPSGSKVSGLLMRYLGKVADLERLFGNLDGMHLIEIGVGFGGFASVLLRMHPGIASYTLVDLPEVLNIAQRYLSEAHVATKIRYISAAPCKNLLPAATLASLFEPRAQGYDLAISMYAFAEVALPWRQAYFEKILARSTRGFISDHIHHESLHLKVEYLLPEMLLSASKTSLDSQNSPNMTAHIVIRDFMSGKAPMAPLQAQVGWGVVRDYYPELIQQMRGRRPSWNYEAQKLTIGAPFTCLTKLNVCNP